MGIEVWALLALVVVLTAYLLPFLVGRREVMKLSRSDDRYSADLRILATGETAMTPDEACEQGGHARIFRRLPEVRAMNRPAVRNVRALRVERELAQAQRAHDAARARRRDAAANRARVAAGLLGVSLGLWLVGLVTVIPWWPALLPTALLGVSMVAGHKAARASLAADRAEWRRVVALRRDLDALAGARPTSRIEPAAPRVAAPTPAQGLLGTSAEGSDASEGQAVLAEGAEANGMDTGRDTGRDSVGSASRAASAAEPAAHEESAESVSAPAASGAEETVGEAARASDEAEAARPIEWVMEPRPLESADDAPVEPHSTDADQGGGAGIAAAIRHDDAREALSAGSGTEGAAEVGGGELAQSRSAGPLPIRRDATSTPPQGWRPVAVPAPTYTLAARARRRAVPDLELPEAESVPSPVRPRNARAYAPAPILDDEQAFKPIDLDEVLERRRAAGA
ncbi:hypothetical protein CHIBA101_2193 [Actinomyces sp. Chiba101]|uniref:hypothetical protein n=1 Tax=Actinomyces TaxID=1654 RepID=UPI000974DCD8|nr:MULTISPECIES: hypothetical protein [Actinomyces]BAW94017.1 hypothetical protein CHIBA101_2193 [Actinomyces sp. Chiba101]GAV95435.1 hypothetical protein ADENT20671_2222 [Actinomyces denticolens]SUU02740.1 Uncharacterised protein [Actinomyces denticolens]